MRRASSICWSLLVLTSLFVLNVSANPTNTNPTNRRSLATITGTVTDTKGNPVSGAVVSLIREGVKTVKEIKTDRKGTFLAKVLPGRYGISAIADGFSRVVFTAVDVQPSQELVYRFNLEPIGYGNTLPERRRDREDAKWTLRSAQTHRSIFQAQQGEDATVAAVEEATTETPAEVTQPTETSSDSRSKTHGVFESYFAGNGFAPSYAGVNFAISTPLSDGVELVLAGQTGVGSESPERLEASTLFHVGHRHRVGVTAAGMRLPTPVWINHLNNTEELFGQVSLRAVDEWIVRDGIVIVMGLDYSRFIGAGDAHAITPRFGVQYDVNARTRVKLLSRRPVKKMGFKASRISKASKWSSARNQPVQSLSWTDRQYLSEVIGWSSASNASSTIAPTLKRLRFSIPLPAEALVT